MADLIDRAALIASIDELHEHCGHCDGYGYISKDKAMQKVKAAPAVDAVEVVRCEACKSFGLHSHGRYGFCSHPHGLMSPKPDQFCSYGERRTDATD